MVPSILMEEAITHIAEIIEFELWLAKNIEEVIEVAQELDKDAHINGSGRRRINIV